MESSAPKRRRTSPRTSAPVDPNNTARETTPDPTPRDASPSRSPKRRRPSPASPTDSRLARRSPEVLARRPRVPQDPAGVEAEERRGGEGGSAVDDTPASLPGSQHSDVSLSELLRARNDAPPSRSPLKPVPIARPLPPPAPEGEDLVDPFTRRDRIRRSNQGQEEEEPELPPTPSQLGLEGGAASTPPAGIHSESSPLKRRQAGRERRGVVGSSPLKKMAAARVAPREESPVDRLVNPQEGGRGAVEAHHARGVRGDAEIAEKEDYLEALKQEEESLWSDLQLMADLGREWAEGEGAEQVMPLVKKHPTLLPQPEEGTSAGTGSFNALLQGAMDPSAWLPFSNPPQPEPKEESLPAPQSHHPVPMTAAEELPFLQILTPFTIASTGAPLSTSDMNTNTRRHTISLRASSHPALFSAQLSLSVDLSDFSVSDIKVLRLDPNAEAELGPFVDDVLTRTDRAFAGNVSVVCWAMGEWFRVAARRAAFWRELFAEVGSDVMEGNVGELWRRRGAVVARGVEESVDERLVEVKGGSAAGLLPYMGTVAATVPLGVCGEGVMVRLRWGISFDWTGDARSEVDVAVGVPGHCESSFFPLSHILHSWLWLVANVLQGTRETPRATWRVFRRCLTTLCGARATSRARLGGSLRCWPT